MSIDIYRPRVYGAAAAVPLALEGRFFVEAGTSNVARLMLVSQLGILTRPADERQARYRETRALGFNGFRVFCGHLSGFATQTPEQARQMLPIVLDEAAAHGFYVYVCAITGGKDPAYDIGDHLAQIVAICAGRPTVILEGANEIGHPTLSPQATVPWLTERMSRLVPRGQPWTVGAPVDTDEPTEEGVWVASGGPFNDAHLDRGRDKWNQVRRLRELYAIVESTHCAQMNGEMIGADEQMGGSTGTKQRRNDPDFFFAAGVLSRGFELATLFHSQAGLEARALGPVQTQCALEFARGFTCIPTTDRLTFMNAGWAGSPVAAANFDAVVRCYSYITGARGWTVLLGITGDPKVVWGGGWRPVDVIAQTVSADGQTQVVAITR